MNILHQIPTETKIKRELKKVLFGQRLFCPRCGSKTIKKYGGRYYCQRCRKPFSLKSVNWLKGMKLSYQTFWLLLWCWVNKVPLNQARKMAGVSEPTARRWYEGFRGHLPKERLSEISLSGIVQMDEAYRGGKNKGYTIIGAKQQARSGSRRKMVLQVIEKPSVDRKDVLTFISQCVVPDSQLQTDGYSVYRGIERWWLLKHLSERHNRWEFGLTSEIEGLWGCLTTFVRRMYHHITREKVGEVVQEFTARQVCPEWFRDPQSFLEVSFKPLIRIERKPGKPRKKIYQSELSVFPIPASLNQLACVPS